MAGRFHAEGETTRTSTHRDLSRREGSHYSARLVPSAGVVDDLIFILLGGKWLHRI